MKRNVDFNIVILLFFGLGSILLVSTNDLCAREKIDGRRFQNGFIITLVLRDGGSENYSRDLRQPVFDVYVYEADGSLVANWSSCYETLDLPIPIHLKMGGEFTQIKSWESNVLDPKDEVINPLPPGRYYLKRTWLGGPIIETGLISVDIV